MAADQKDEPDSPFPRALSVLFVVSALGLIVGGFCLWWPARDSFSTAQSDLGLALLGGGLAVTAGFVVARAVFGAERSLNRRLQQSEEVAARENLKFSLSLAESLQGANLRERDLPGLRIYQKDVRGADFSGSDLRDATFINSGMNGSLFVSVDARSAQFGLADPSQTVDLSRANFQHADLRDAAIRGDARRADFSGADLRGADLSGAWLSHPNPEGAGPDEDLPGQRAIVTAAKYDSHTRWPHGFDPAASGAELVE